MIAKYYRDRDGNEPVRERIDSLPEATQLLLHRQIDRLNGLTKEQPNLAFPSVRK